MQHMCVLWEGFVTQGLIASSSTSFPKQEIEGKVGVVCLEQKENFHNAQIECFRESCLVHLMTDESVVKWHLFPDQTNEGNILDIYIKTYTPFDSEKNTIH